MNSASGRSHSSMLRTRSALVRKRGSSIMSARPIARNSRSAMVWIEAEIEMKRPSLVSYTLRGAVLLRAAADARLDPLREPVDRGFRAEHREDRIEQRQVDHLARAAALLDLAQRDQHGVRAVKSRHHVGERERRQHRRAVGEAVLRRKARHALDQAAEAGLVAIGPVLPPARHAHDDQLADWRRAARPGRCPFPPACRGGNSR